MIFFRLFIGFLILAPFAVAEDPSATLKIVPTAKESLQSIVLSDKNFIVKTFASEPDVGQPTAVYVDWKNRLWIAENYSYEDPMYQPEREYKPDPRDQVSIYEDTDGDGVYDKKKIFTKDVGYVFGLTFGGGGLWVAAPPNLLFFPDKDKNDIPDSKPEVKLDGWALNDPHTAVNNLIWGPDGWLYGNHGVFCNSKIGKPGTPIEERIRLNAGVWRYHTSSKQFEVFARGTGNPWGLDFSDDGQTFVTLSAMPHLWHISEGATYMSMTANEVEPPIFEGIKDIGGHSHVDISHAPASHAHAGLEIYNGNNFPDEYRNAFLMLNIGARALYYDFIEPEGSGFKARHGGEILHFTDNWFLGAGLKMGAHGELYLLDFNDYALHGQSVEGRNTGRIYRVSYKTSKFDNTVNLEQKSSEELLTQIFTGNSWAIDISTMLLRERQQEGKLSADVLKVLQELAFSKLEAVTKRLKALLLLHQFKKLSVDQVFKIITDDADIVRAWGIQIALEDKMPTTELLRFLEARAEQETSPIVRRYFGSALQKIPPQNRWKLAGILLGDRDDNGDQNLPLIYWYGVKDLFFIDKQRFRNLIANSKIDKVKTLGEKILDQVTPQPN